MKRLSYEFQPLLEGAVVITATLRRRAEREDIYLCDTWSELEQAMADGKPFIGHRVIGINPVDLIINPSNVATIEKVSR
jgi:hypothetical protein